MYTGLIGIPVLVAVAVLLSKNRRAINLRTVGGAFAIQAAMAAFALYVPFGKDVIAALSHGVENFMQYGAVGTRFIFGELADTENMGFIFAIKVLPVIVYFSAVMSVLYYLGIMQRIVATLGGLLRWMLGTSYAESMSASANVFIGQSEAPLVVRPYLRNMTESELFAVMCGGTASIAGAVMMGYASMGVDLNYLLAASFMAAPGGLLIAKLMIPETEETQTDIRGVSFDEEEQPANVIDAAADGAFVGVKLAVAVGSMLLAFVAIIALLNGMLGGVGGYFGHGDITFQHILGYVFAPIAWLIGVPVEEAAAAGSLLGQKLVLNEFVAFVDLMSGNAEFTPRTNAIVVFALCGFANFASIAVLLGGLGSLVPERRHDIARLGLRAVAAGTLANLMSATLAGLFISLGGGI